MNALLAAVVLFASAWAARRLTRGTMTDRLAEALGASTVFVAIFLGAFFVQGFVELASHRPTIGLPAAAGLTLAIAAAAAVLRRRPPVRTTGVAAPSPPMRPIARAIAIGTVATFALLGGLLLLGLPRGYEVKAYHLPIAVRLLRDGTLGLWDHGFMHAYPANMSIWAGVFLDAVPERWVAIANLPFLALACVASYALARAAGADRSAAVIATAGLATVPLFGFSALELGADVAGVAFVLVAALMIATRPAPTATRAVVAGLAAGLAFGFKSLNLVPVAGLGLVLVAQCVRAWRADRDARALLPVLAFTGAALGLMAFWLARNAVEAGNPLYPIHLGRLFDMLGWKAAPDFDLATRLDNEKEWVGRSRDWLAYPWVEGHVLNQNFKHSSGLGPFFAATIPVVVVLWPIHALAALRAGTRSAALGVQAVLFAVAVAVGAAWWLLGDRQPRYGMVAIAALVPIVAAFVSMTGGRLRTAYEALLATCVAAMALVLVVRLGVENGPFLTTQRGAARWQALQYARAVDTLPAGAVVGNTLDRPVDYSLLGAGFRNRVVDPLELQRTFGGSGGGLRLTKAGVAALGLTHIYALDADAPATDGCVALREVGRFDRNPFNGRPVSPASVLYALDDRCR